MPERRTFYAAATESYADINGTRTLAHTHTHTHTTHKTGRERGNNKEFYNVYTS